MRSFFFTFWALLVWGDGAATAVSSFDDCSRLILTTEVNEKMVDPDFKVIIFMRHGKATDRDRYTSAQRAEDPSLVPLDKKRELTSKGKKAVRSAIQILSQLSYDKTAMFVSSADRALQTAQMVKSGINATSGIFHAEDRFYYADVGRELSDSLTQPEFDDYRHAIFVGHGKTTNAFVAQMTAATEGIFNPTAGVLIVAVKAKSWREYFEGSHDEVFLYGWSPKNTQVINGPRPLMLVDRAHDESIWDGIDPDIGNYFEGILNDVDLAGIFETL